MYNQGDQNCQTNILLAIDKGLTCDGPLRAAV